MEIYARSQKEKKSKKRLFQRGRNESVEILITKIPGDEQDILSSDSSGWIKSIVFSVYFLLLI